MSPPGEIWMRWRVRAAYFVAAVSLYLAAPSPRSIALGAVIAAAGLALRAVAAGHLYKGERLSTSGPYAWMRNPLYLGSVILGAGLAIAARSWIAALLLFIYFVLFFGGVMRREEHELRAAYGAAFDNYAAQVPLFLPRLPRAHAETSPARFSWALYRRNREYQAAIGFAVGIAMLWLRMWFASRIS